MSLVKVVFVPDLESPNHVVDGLVDPFHDGVCLRIAYGDWLTLNPVVGSKHVLDFFCELASSVEDDFGRPWMSRQPCEFQCVGDVIRSWSCDADDLEPSCGWIDHCEAAKFDLLFFFAELIFPNEVYAQCVPWSAFRVLLGWQLPEFDFLFLRFRANGACSACLLYGGS